MTTHATPDLAQLRPTPPWVWLHHALMPDYNRKAAGYWLTLVLLGASTLLYSALGVASLPLGALAQILVGLTAATIAGCFPVRIGHSKSSFAAGEVFIFLLLLLHGPAAAALAAACESAVGAFRTSKRWTSRIASPAISSLTMFTLGWLLQAGLHALERGGLNNGGLTVIAAMLFSVIYFSATTLLVSAVPRLKRNEPLALADLLSVFGWVGIAFAASGAVAGLLYLTYQISGVGVLAAVVPIMATLLATLHYYRRHQEANEAMREAAAQAVAREAQAATHAAQREAEIATRHLEQLRDSERRFHSAFTHASIGMALVSVNGHVLQANDALRELLAVDDTQLLERSFQSFVVEADRPALNDQLALVADEDFEDFTLEVRCQNHAGREIWVSAHCSFFSEPDSPAPCLILQAHDISARRIAEAGLQRLAFHDSLTGLPNRRRFGEMLTQAVEAARADAKQGFAVMFIDFDRFKLINDSLGHAAGDDFLVQVAHRARETVRPGDTIARLGGDEFAVLLRGVEHEADVITLADRLLRVLRHPLLVAGAQLRSSASIGITTSLVGYESAEDALRDADIAMYRAKAAGKDRYALFDATLHAEVTRRVGLERDLSHAVANGQISLAYQPLYELATARLLGFEALARWMHPEQGAIGPDVFIPIAEETGLIVPLTDYVLHRACQDLKQWQQSDPAFAQLTMNVNISGKDLAHSALVARMTHALVAARLEPQFLIVELTENILMDQLKVALPQLEEMRTLGVGLSVDDFGTGYSSLAHLSTLPVDSLKIDRSFINGMRSGSKEAAVVRAVVNLGRSLNKRVVAEGIETETQFAQLRDMGCDVGQGYHMSRPLTAVAIERLLVRSLLDVAPAGIRTPAVSLSALH